MGPINSFFGYIAAATFAVGITVGWKVKDWQCDAAYASALEKAEKQRKQLQGRIDEISKLYEEERNQADVVVSRDRVKIREIYKDLPPVPADCAPDSRVVGMLQSSIGNANSAASGKSGK